MSARRIVLNGRPQVDRRTQPGQRLPLVLGAAIAAPRLIDKEIEPVLLEDIKGIRAADHAEVVEADAGRRARRECACRRTGRTGSG